MFATFWLGSWMAGVAQAGVLVGHPVDVVLADTDGLTFSSATLPVAQAQYTACSGSTVQIVPVNDDLDLLTPDTVTIPVGVWCDMRLVLSARLVGSGSGTAGGTFDVSLGVGWIDIAFASPVVVAADGSSDVDGIELAAEDWMTATMIGLTAGNHVSIGASHTLHDTLRDAVREDSTIW